MIYKKVFETGLKMSYPTWCINMFQTDLKLGQTRVVGVFGHGL